MSEPTATPVAPAGDGALAPPAPSKRRRFLIAAGAALPLLLGAFVLVRGHGSDAPPRVRREPGVLVLEPFVVNLGEADVGRFLKCAVRLELADAGVAARIQAEPLTLLRVQDGLLSILSCASAEDLAQAGGKDALRSALLRRAREVLPEAGVADVYFQEFLFQ
jgi:flagellar basal body-associated protein FliL